jgi:predicted enzyme related to lactoylglutathione lyase
VARVVHFEIHTDDPQRAIRFYTDLFGWSFQKFEHADYWLVTTGPSDQPGIDGGLMPREGGKSGDRITSYVCVVDVPDIDATIAKAKSLGAPQTDAKTPVPGIGWSAYFKDTEGNTFGVFQSDTNAA